MSVGGSGGPLDNWKCSDFCLTSEKLDLFTMILENRGYSLDTYSDPAAALLKFKPNYYDLLLLDYRMSNLNGLELYAQIRKMDPTARALLLTAYHEQFIEGKTKSRARLPEGDHKTNF
jgi:CheY-like chemotaxis protein